MKMHTSFEGKHVLVVGLARSGIAAAELLVQLGAVVTINDSKKEEELGKDVAVLRNLPLTCRYGVPAMELLDGQEILVLSPGIPDSVAFVVEAKRRGIRVIAEIELAYEASCGRRR